MSTRDVIIIGSGPAGLGVAAALVRAGVSDILVLERETEIGGIPRHTHHPSFGLLVFKRPMTGPAYIARLRARCKGVEFRTGVTATAVDGDRLSIATPEGPQTLRARHIVLATGARETPRHPRLVTGLRPMGIMTTGALQQFIYTGGMKPFSRPMIIGTELVSFSALWTLRHAGIKPVAMIEPSARVTAYRPATLFARLLGVPIHYRASVTDIAGRDTLTHIEIDSPAGRRKIDCDGVIFSGCFTGDNNLARGSGLALSPDTHIPLVDQNWLGADPRHSVVGNTTHPADMGDQCYQEALVAGAYIAKLLQSGPPQGEPLPIRHGNGIKMTTPNMLRPDEQARAFSLNLHVTRAWSGDISVTQGDKTLYRKRHSCLPARRITLKGIRFDTQSTAPLQVSLG